MGLDPRTPVIVGVGQVNVAEPPAPEPLELLVSAARSAAADAGGATNGERLLAGLDAIRLVPSLTRHYPDPAALLAERIGADPRHRGITSVSGHQPQALVNLTSAQIARGELDAALIGGAEAWRTRNAYKRAGERPQWSTQDDSARPTERFGEDKPFFGPAEVAAGVSRPTDIYPIFETALRSKLGRSSAEHHKRVTELWAEFARVAVDNPYAVLREGYTAARIGTPGPDNRMINYPYPKLMNSNSSVDQAAVLLLCSVERARALGLPEERWVFPVSGAGANDTDTPGARHELAASPAIRHAGAAALRLAGITPDQLDIVDLYSCFPSAVQVSAAELGLPPGRPLTITGGLTFAGGPWCNYPAHAIATMAGLVRERPESYALVTGNGGMLTKHAIGVYAGRPNAAGYRVEDAQPLVAAEPTRRSAPEDYRGRAVVEGYTVAHDRDGRPTGAMIAALTPAGDRAWFARDDAETLARALTGELDNAEVTV
ncbi:acetyl-CoA C-acetyltransferase [Pseudonocardia eucalypti]|uniref:hypothetical protein n=1 Tax=Pseudonocardia eucalypti TaxID=648755 RepID=UPI00160A6A89|nr:acetyl-CoA C-acetyltransferase [Pseudonocardia eucalypti]